MTTVTINSRYAAENFSEDFSKIKAKVAELEASLAGELGTQGLAEMKLELQRLDDEALHLESSEIVAGRDNKNSQKARAKADKLRQDLQDKQRQSKALTLALDKAKQQLQAEAKAARELAQRQWREDMAQLLQEEIKIYKALADLQLQKKALSVEGAQAGLPQLTLQLQGYDPGQAERYGSQTAAFIQSCKAYGFLKE